MKHARIIKAAVAAVAVFFLVYYVDPRDMAAAAAEADLRWVLAALLLMPLNVYLEGSVWHFLACLVDERTSRIESFGALFTGYALGFFTPGRAGEFAGRAYYVRHADKWEIAAVVGLQRLLDTGVAVFLGTFALFVYMVLRRPAADNLWIIMGVAGVVVGGLLTGAGLAPRRAHAVACRLLPFDGVRKRIGFLRNISTNAGAKILGLNAARYAVYTTQFYLLLRALVPSADPAAGYLGVGLTFLAKFLVPSFTLMDLGIREGAAVYFLGSLGFPEAAALNASLLLFVVNLLIPAAVGVRFVLRLRLDAASGESEPSSSA